MKKGVTCHKTETSFVMRFTKEVWLACNANEADLFANEIHQHDANLKSKTNSTKSSRKNVNNKDVRKFNRSWSTNADDVDDHMFSNGTIGQKQEENCTKMLIDTLSRKVKRHRKTQPTKKPVKPKRTMSCQDYDMSAIEGIFANDSTIEYDSDKTVDLNFCISENKSSEGPVTNSFINSLARFHDIAPVPPGPLLEKACKTPNTLSRLTCSIDEYISVASSTLSNSNHATSQKLSEIDLMSNPLNINFVPSVSSAFNINFSNSLSKTSSVALISDPSKHNIVASKSPEPVFSSFPNFPQLSHVSKISENPRILEGLNISNCTDILDSSSTSLSTIDFYMNHSGFTPLNRSPENTKSVTELAEQISNPESLSVDESKSNKLKVSLNVESNEEVLLEIYPPLNNKLDVLHEKTTDLPRTSKCEERSVESRNCKDKLLDDKNISSDNINTFVKNIQSLNKKVTSKKSSHPQRGRKRKRRRNTTRINKGKSLKQLSDSLNYSENQDLIKPANQSIGANFDDGFQGETDTDTIPLELDDGFAEADTDEIPFNSDSKEFVYSSCNDVIPKVHSNSIVDNNLKEDADSNVTCPDINNLDCNGNVSTTMQSKNNSANVNVNSDFTVLSISSEIPGEVPRHLPVELPKLEVVCDAMSDDLEIVDLEDIEVDEVVNVSEEVKDSSSQNIIEGNMADEHRPNATDESNKVGASITDSELHSKDDGTNIKYVDDLQDAVRKHIKDSNDVVGLEDYVVSDDSPAEPSEEFMKAESEESTQDMLPSIQPFMECLEDLTVDRHNNEREDIIPKEILTTRKWERPNIFENLTAKVNLPIKGENVKINSNFMVNSFAQKLVVELLGENDEITFTAKNSFSIEETKKASHDFASGQSEMNVFPAVIDVDDPIPSVVLGDSSSDNEQQGENISFTGESFERPFETSQGDLIKKAVDQSIQNFVATSPNALPMSESFPVNMDSLNKDAFAVMEPSARKSFKGFIGRFVKRLTHSSKRYVSHSSTIMKSRFKNSSSLKTTGYSKITTKSKQELSDGEILRSEVLSLLTEETYQGMSAHERDFSTEDVVPTSSSESIVIPGLDSPPESFSCDFDPANATFSSQSRRKMGISSKVNVNAGVHLTSSFQPHVNIIPLPLESLTRLAMKTNQEFESLSCRDENSFEAVNESLAFLSVASRCSEFERITNFTGIDSSLSGNTSDAGEESKSVDKKNPSTLEERGEAWNTRKRKSSFLEALNMPNVQLYGHRRSKRNTRDDNKLTENDEKPCQDKISKTFDKPQENISDKTKKKSSTLTSGRSRSKSRKLSSAEKMPSSSALKSSESFLQSKDFLASMESILPLMGKSNVMSLPKIKKLSDTNSTGLLPQRGCESYGVLEKLEKAMAEDELKKFNTQSIKKVLSSSMSSVSKSHAMSLTSSTLTSPKSSENLSTQSINHVRGSNPDHASGRGALSSEKNVNQRNFRAFNLSNQEHQPLAVASKPDMKVGVDLPWMRKNRSHDPLGLVEDEEICESDKLQSNFDKADIEHGVKSESWPAPRRRVRFITPRSLEIENQTCIEPELNRDESYFVSKLNDDLRDLEVIVGVQQRMANPENEEPGYFRNDYRYGESCVSSNDNYRRPYWRNKFERGYFQRPHFFEPFNNRRYVQKRFDNRGSRWPQFPKKFQDYPTPESANTSSLFQTPSSSGSEGGFVQNVDYPDADECQSKVAEGETYSEKMTDDGHFKRQQGKSVQYPPWRSSHNYYPWQPTRKYYKQSAYGRDEGSNGLKNEKSLSDPRSFHTPPYHDFSYYSYPCSQDIASNSIYNNFANPEMHHNDGTNKSSQLLSLVKSKVTKHLSRSPLSVENHHNIVEDIMRKLASEHHKALMMKAKASMENEEGECDDSECENVDSDLDYMIKQYLQEFGPYYIASQTHPRTQHH